MAAGSSPAGTPSPRAFLINGRWRTTQVTLPIKNPFNGETVAEVCQGGAEEAEDAVHAAVEAFPITRRLPSHVRADKLHAVADRLRVEQEQFSRTIALESGKPIYAIKVVDMAGLININTGFQPNITGVHQVRLDAGLDLVTNRLVVLLDHSGEIETLGAANPTAARS